MHIHKQIIWLDDQENMQIILFGDADGSEEWWYPITNDNKYNDRSPYINTPWGGGQRHQAINPQLW